MNIELAISHVIYQARIKSGKSQRELARDMDSPRTYISKIENGKAAPTLKSLARFSAALGLKTSELVRMAEESPEGEDLPREKVSRTPGRQSTALCPKGNTVFPKGALVRNPAAVELRQEIGRALGTLPKETR